MPGDCVMVAPTYFRTLVQTRSRVDGTDRPGAAMIRCVASYRGELQEGRVVEIRVSVRQGCAPGAGPEGKPRGDPAGVYGVHRAARRPSVTRPDGQVSASTASKLEGHVSASWGKLSMLLDILIIGHVYYSLVSTKQ